MSIKYNFELSDQLYFAKEAAEYLGVTVQRLNTLIKEGKIKPLKKNSSGTVFHIDELNRRKNELDSFSRITADMGNGSFEIDTPVKQEALNFSVLMSVAKITESKLDPVFTQFSKEHNVSIPMIDNNMLEIYSTYFNLDAKELIHEYAREVSCFSNLQKNDMIIKRGDNDYPQLLALTAQAPRFLYIRGRKSLLYETRTVALVGSRNATERARQNTRYLSNVLGRNGITVISGLARGIDVNAHIAALKNGYNTISVIGTNLNQYYPSENKEIQMEIEKKGLVISQFSPALKTERWFFPLRNGVMSGLSLATVIMEAGETSGALKQADFALKQGRQVLIPESALNIPSINWPKKYIKRGATLVKTPVDVLKALADNNIFNPELVLDKSDDMQLDLFNSGELT